MCIVYDMSIAMKKSWTSRHGFVQVHPRRLCQRRLPSWPSLRSMQSQDSLPSDPSHPHQQAGLSHQTHIPLSASSTSS
jgi:hypothetical protein